jgi:hypothetical protein
MGAAARAGALGFLGVTLLTVLAMADPGAVITVHLAEVHQTMSGWEATARLWEINKGADRYDSSWEEHRGEIFTRLVNELGINRVRIELRSGAENPVDYWARFRDGIIGYREFRRHYYHKVNDNDDPQRPNPAGFQFSALDYQVEKIVRPLERLLEANGERLFVNLNYVDFRDTAEQGSLSHALNPAEYAELIHAAFEHLKRRHDRTPDGLEIVLEPENTLHWRGRQIGAAVVAAARRLKEAGFSPRIIAPSTTAAGAAPRYIDELIRVPGAAALLSELSYHRYDGHAAIRALPEIAKRAKRFGLTTAMLEHVGGDVQELYTDLTIANVSAWQQYGIATARSSGGRDAGSYYYLLQSDRGNKPVVTMAERTRGLAQYFRFIRERAVRLGAIANRSDYLPVAFRNPDGTHVVVVQAMSAGAVTVLGAPSGVYGLRYTTATETGRELPPIRIGAGQPIVANLPAPGVITFYQKSH